MKLSRKLLSILLLLILTAGAALAENHGFTLYNYSGKTITYITLIPSWKPGPWDKVLDGRTLLRHGESIKINSSDFNENEPYWDMRLEYSNGTHESWSELDILNINTISVDVKGTIHWNF